MANTNEPRGAYPATAKTKINYYVMGATAIYPGDFVVFNSGGKVTVAAAGGTQLLGVSAAYRAANGADVPVYDDPDQLYWIQDDGVSATLAQTSVGNNFDIVATAANTTMLKSKHMLDTSDTSAAATANLRLLQLHPSDEVGKYVRCLVAINEHTFAKKTGGV